MNSKKQVKYAKDLIEKVLEKYKERQIFPIKKKVKHLEVNKEYLEVCSYEELEHLIKNCWRLIDGKIETIGTIAEALVL